MSQSFCSDTKNGISTRGYFQHEPKIESVTLDIEGDCAESIHVTDVRHHEPRSFVSIAVGGSASIYIDHPATAIALAAQFAKAATMLGHDEKSETRAGILATLDASIATITSLKAILTEGDDEQARILDPARPVGVG